MLVMHSCRLQVKVLSNCSCNTALQAIAGEAEEGSAIENPAKILAGELLSGKHLHCARDGQLQEESLAKHACFKSLCSVGYTNKYSLFLHSMCCCSLLVCDDFTALPMTTSSRTLSCLTRSRCDFKGV